MPRMIRHTMLLPCYDARCYAICCQRATGRWPLDDDAAAMSRCRYTCRYTRTLAMPWRYGHFIFAMLRRYAILSAIFDVTLLLRRL